MLLRSNEKIKPRPSALRSLKGTAPSPQSVSRTPLRCPHLKNGCHGDGTGSWHSGAGSWLRGHSYHSGMIRIDLEDDKDDYRSRAGECLCLTRIDAGRQAHMAGERGDELQALPLACSGHTEHRRTAAAGTDQEQTRDLPRAPEAAFAANQRQTGTPGDATLTLTLSALNY
ncbi:hypothetical protein DNTS_003979 [Danionella cerebrum]|uniref:Uncharacterized protein n=1 Tax=Danionella cerebrum TaxID=2873325 RepID=A0A553PZ91_9TELE|nr:hypothetical protein DNTS_003979 [Danionella translucida]